MANEASITVSVNVKKSSISLDYRSNPTAFKADVANPRQPYPGLVRATEAGIDVSFSGVLTTPGIYVIHNIGAYPVDYGLHDGSIFHRINRVEPGEIWPGRFAPDFGQEATIPTSIGSGTDVVANTFRLRSVGGDSDVHLDVFDS